MTNETNDGAAARPDAAAVASAPPGSAVPGLAQPTNDVGAGYPGTDYNEAGVPSLDFVRDKIEGRYGRSLGSTELAQETPEARSFQEQAAKREEAAHDRLEAIRRSLRGDAPS